MRRSEEELRMLEEERREKRADNSGGIVDPYSDDEYPVNVETPSQPVERKVKSLPRTRNRPSGTVPRSESKVLHILGVADDSAVNETPLEPNEALEQIMSLKEERARKRLGDQAVQRSIDTHPSGEFLSKVGGSMRWVDPKELARELGVPVTVKKDPFGNRVVIPLFPERKHKKNK